MHVQRADFIKFVSPFVLALLRYNFGLFDVHFRSFLLVTDLDYVIVVAIYCNSLSLFYSVFLHQLTSFYFS